ncbi:MAG: hypothetical protein KME21_15610 [Desmonostoc vinosum HA7617-LM4]|jgi:uncharacterized membrane protein YeaQ/YmgE (transglycosylase-associated protein family)|nr:hypothetical protein [Desmonostoc vinosum HA7617-LM4]
MFSLLTWVLVWLLIGTVAYSVFQRFYPSGSFVGRLFLGIIVVVIALAFINPNERPVASLWSFISFPLKPLGASILMMLFAAQKINKGGIDKPGGYLIGWSLIILLLASTPAVAYLLYRIPLGGTAMTNQIYVASAAPTSAANISGIAKDSIFANNLRVPPYLLQNPEDIRRRNLEIVDFVPSAETLQLTTRVWETYLAQIYRFLRLRQS